MIGSAAVASYKSIGCSNVSIAMVVAWAREQGMDVEWLEGELMSNPEILHKLK